MRTWKSTSIGGRAQTCRCVVMVKSAVADRVHSCPPWIRGSLIDHAVRERPYENIQGAYFHTTTFSAGTYLAFPFATLQSTVVVFKGVGIRNTTFVAESLLLKFAFMVIVYETWVVPISVTVGMIRRGSFTFEVERYLDP